MKGKQHWGAFGLRFASEIPLDPLVPVEGPADVRISLRRDATLRSDNETDFSWHGDDRIHFRLEGIEYEVTGGRDIAITAPAEPSIARIQIWLLGSVMGSLLLQRGLLTLHANAVAFGDGQAAAFVGESGDGKSTLAAALSAAGHRALCDDLLAVEIDDEGTAWVRPGIPRVKVTPAAASALGIDISKAPRVAADVDKAQLPLPHHADWDRRFRLTRLYELQRGDPATIQPLQGIRAGQLILANLFRPTLDEARGDDGPRFQRALALGRAVDAFAFARPFALDRLAEGIEAVTDHLASDPP